MRINMNSQSIQPGQQLTNERMYKQWSLWVKVF